MTIEISRAGSERLDDLRPLFLALHEHHRHVTPKPIPLVADDAAAWAARRAGYAELLADGSGFLHVADDAGTAVGSRLLAAVDELIAGLEVSALQVAVMADNEDAIRLYRRHGLVTGEILMYRFPAG